MNQLKVEKCYPQNDLLRRFIKYFWVIRDNNERILSYKLLPVNNIDVVLNFGASMNYVAEKKVETSPEYSFTGIRNRFQMVSQTGALNIFGVSFFPTGFYPFLRTPLSECINQTIDFGVWNKHFKELIEVNFNPEGKILRQIEILEDILLKLIDITLIPDYKTFALFDSFEKNMFILSIKEFCDQYGINQKRLERIFRKYIGVSPKQFQRVNRFQIALNRIIMLNMEDLTTVAHESFYYDQAHFIHDFKSFAGCAPSQFLSEKKSMMQNLKI